MFMLAIAACYDVQHEVFGRKDGVLITGLEGEYLRIGGAGDSSHYVVSRSGRGNDYGVTKGGSAPGATDEVGSLRAIQLGPDLYIAQLHYARASKAVVDLYAFLVIRTTSADGIVMKIEEQIPETETADSLADRDHVEIWRQNKGADGLSGARPALVRFLRHVATAPSSAGATYLRIAEGEQ